MSVDIEKKVESKIKEDLSPTRNLTGFHLKLVASIAITWSLFQLWYASPFPFWFNFGMFKGLPARAIHLGFALLLAFLIFPYARGKKVNFIDIIIAVTGAICCLYIYVFYDQLVDRGGILLKINFFYDFTIPIELILGIIGISILLEATRRVIGIPLVVIAVCFLLFSYFGQYAPDIISHGGLSLKRLVGFQWFDQEAIFGIPIGVSVDFIFLFVLFGALLETAGGGKYFLDLAFAMVGKMRGGPAKAAILGSGMTGLISGSSIANTVTTGTFTIPIMKKTGFSKEKAGAIEVSSSVNGQIMPPVMGAAAFVMASFIGVTYFEVVKHAFLPAIISYIALFYISHLEALKLNLKGMDERDIPKLKKTFFPKTNTVFLKSFCSLRSFEVKTFFYPEPRGAMVTTKEMAHPRPTTSTVVSSAVAHRKRSWSNVPLGISANLFARAVCAKDVWASGLRGIFPTHVLCEGFGPVLLSGRRP